MKKQTTIVILLFFISLFNSVNCKWQIKVQPTRTLLPKRGIGYDYSIKATQISWMITGSKKFDLYLLDEKNLNLFKQGKPFKFFESFYNISYSAFSYNEGEIIQKKVIIYAKNEVNDGTMTIQFTQKQFLEDASPSFLSIFLNYWWLLIIPIALIIGVATLFGIFSKSRGTTISNDYNDNYGIGYSGSISGDYGSSVDSGGFGGDSGGDYGSSGDTGDFGGGVFTQFFQPMKRVFFNKTLLKNNQTTIRYFSFKEFMNEKVENTKKKLYNTKIFFKWVQFHLKKYAKEIYLEHHDTIPNPPDFVPKKRLSVKEYVQGVLIPGIKFTWKNKFNSMKMMEEKFLSTRTPEIMDKLRKQGHDFTELEKFYGLDFEQELEDKKREKSEEEKYVIEENKQEILLKETQSELKASSKIEKNKEKGEKITEYFRFGSQLFYNSLRQFVIGYNEGIGREYKPEKLEKFKQQIFDEKS
eukprot:gene5594-9409_t